MRFRSSSRVRSRRGRRVRDHRRSGVRTGSRCRGAPRRPDRCGCGRRSRRSLGKNELVTKASRFTGRLVVAAREHRDKLQHIEQCRLQRRPDARPTVRVEQRPDPFQPGRPSAADIADDFERVVAGCVVENALLVTGFRRPFGVCARRDEREVVVNGDEPSGASFIVAVAGPSELRSDDRIEKRRLANGGLTDESDGVAHTLGPERGEKTPPSRWRVNDTLSHATTAPLMPSPSRTKI